MVLISLSEDKILHIPYRGYKITYPFQGIDVKAFFGAIYDLQSNTTRKSVKAH